MSPNILENTKTYLIGSMQYQNGESWRKKVQDSLEPLNIKVFNPYLKPFVKDIQENATVATDLLSAMERADYEYVETNMRTIRSYDLNLVDRSDFVIAYINPSVPTFGSIEELTTACRMKKATFIAIEGGKGKCPLWIMGMFPHKYIYNTIDDILNIIIKIDNDEIQIDSDRWKLLRKEYR